MQTFNFFLVATAFLVAAYATLLEKHRGAACVLAVLGSWLALWFNKVDYRNRQLVKAGERALSISETQLAARANIAELKIVEAVERPEPYNFTYGQTINVIQWTIITLFGAGAVYAFLSH
jgi:hypothetical protein